MEAIIVHSLWFVTFGAILVAQFGIINRANIAREGDLRKSQVR